MKHYRKQDGSYIAVDDETPVNSSLVLVAPRPSSDHVFSSNWKTDPLNPLVCWTINLADHKARKRIAINKEAGLRITQHYGILDGKQGNMYKRSLELLRKRAMLVVLTPAETAEENVLLQAGNYVDDVREAGRIAKQAVTAATTVSGVDAVTVNWPTDTPPEWPL